jgi:hypothetical protein
VQSKWKSAEQVEKDSGQLQESYPLR